VQKIKSFRTNEGVFFKRNVKREDTKANGEREVRTGQGKENTRENARKTGRLV